VLLAGCGAAAPPGLPGDAMVATGNEGGVFVTIGRELARAVPVADGTVSVVRTDGSVANLVRLTGGSADVGFSLADTAEAAFGGTGPFEAPQPVCALARLYDSYVQVVVRADSGVTRFDGLRGRRIAIGSAESGSALVANRLLDAAGLVPGRDVRTVHADLAAATAALEAGGIDAMIWLGGLPTAAVADLAARVPLALVDLDGVTTALDDRYDDVYRPSTVPASVYGTPAPVRTLSITNYLMASTAMPPDEVRAWLGALFSERVAGSHREAERLNPRTAIGTGSIPLCAGAAEAYRELGRGDR